jgi:hypothetical protein
MFAVEKYNYIRQNKIKKHETNMQNGLRQRVMNML